MLKGMNNTVILAAMKEQKDSTKENYLGICPPCQKAGSFSTHKAKRKWHDKCYGKDRCYCQHDIYAERVNQGAINQS